MRFAAIFTVLFLSFGLYSQAQINETFSDSNFTNNPQWNGDINKFEVINPPNSGDGSIDISWGPDAHMLRSKPDSTSAVLTTASSRAYGEWLFSIADGRGWAISGSNDYYVIIMSDTDDPALLKDDTKNFNGYFLRFDGANGDNFTFNKQSGTTTTLLIDAAFPDGTDGTTSEAYSVKITRENDGTWEIFIDEGLYLESTTSRGTIVDNEVTTSSFFGIATNIANPGTARTAYIDNIITRAPYVDTYAPVITDIQINGERNIKLTFDELIDSVSSHTASNYNIQGPGNANEAIYYFESKTEVQLTFAESFTSGAAYTLLINGVEDLLGNITDTSIQFSVSDLLNQNINESFTDLDLINNLQWTGDTADFEIINPPTEGNGGFSATYENDGALLRSKINTESRCITTELIRNYGQWSFTVADGNGWNISGTNDYYVILTANTNEPALLKADNPNFYGYYLRYDGSSDDSFVLYKQKGTVSTPIITTTYPVGTDGSASIPYSVKITRDTAEGWSLYIDEGAYEQAVTLRGTSTDNEIQTGNYFGLVTNISTPSDTRVVYMDDIYAGEIIYDTIPPALEDIKTLSSNKLQVTFTEPIDTIQLELTQFSTTLTGNPSAYTVAEAGKQIQLQFANDFPLRETETLNISGIVDLEGNIINDTSVQFVYFIPLEGDIVINEVFFDNSPVVALPEYDYLELYNRSGFDINLENWTIEIGDDTRTFPDYTLEANEYLIVTSSSAVEAYALYGNALDIITTSLLSNNGKLITLKDTTGQSIHTISYNQTWYHDPEKEDGGWSIEQIDPDAFCAQANNWKASTSSLGGTPGEINSVDDLNPDTIAPYIVEMTIASEKEIILTFSETLPSYEIDIQVNYSVGLDSVTVDEEDLKKLHIYTRDSLPQRTYIEVVVLDLTDYCGNTTEADFASTYIVPSYFQQVIFTEIMAKPADEERIQYEYLELYNHDTLPVSIENWTLKVGSRDLNLPTGSIPAQSYYLILPQYMASFPNAPENAIYIFDESDLTDGGTMLQLLDDNNKLVTWIDYDDTWHTNSLATLGGFSLERIDNNRFCDKGDNWGTSTATQGGTPGTENTLKGDNPDETIPTAQFILIPEDTSLLIRFDESMWPDVSNGLIATSQQFDSIFIPHPKGEDLILKLKEPLEDNTLYNISLSRFTDCNMNEMEATDFSFKKPVSAEPGDLIINEILFNPPANCNDFVEVFNLTDNYLALSKLYSANLDASGYPNTINEVAEDAYILPPNQYYILTESTECLEEAYGNVDPKKSILTNLPSMPDDEGTILLMNYSGDIVDQVTYSADMHHSLLDDEDGVSLERISPFSPSDNRSNWHSAAADVGFATPTRENSQYNNAEITENNISLEKETLSPDGDGFEDYLRINYQFKTGGNVLSIKILDHNGRLVRNLLNNETVSLEGFVTWDGTNDSQHKVPVGIYILYSEWFDENGNQGYDKRTCVVAGNLK